MRKMGEMMKFPILDMQRRQTAMKCVERMGRVTTSAIKTASFDQTRRGINVGIHINSYSPLSIRLGRLVQR
jgi:hypothetical protein